MPANPSHNWGKGRALCVISPTLLFLAATNVRAAEDPATFYSQNCAACHSIGGGAMVGPDLKDVLKRRDHAWLERFLKNPQAVVDSGDEYARDLVEQSGGLVMPAVKGLNDEMADALLDYIDAQSKPGQKAAPGKKAEASFTADDVEQGKKIVLGSRSLAGGGAPCISCHTVQGLSGLGGGRLGPDLTRSYERLRGASNMQNWLASPPTPTMQTVYRGHALQPSEIRGLVAYFESAAKQDAANPAPQQAMPYLTFLLIGLGGSIAGLALMDGFWHRRFRAVRRPLVSNHRGRV